MKIKDLFEKWGLTGLRIKTPFLDLEWKPSDSDKAAAWDLYVELLTRITTQPLPDEDGVEQTALDSIHALFGITRKTLKDHGRELQALQTQLRNYTRLLAKLADVEDLTGIEAEDL